MCRSVNSPRFLPFPRFHVCFLTGFVKRAGECGGGDPARPVDCVGYGKVGDIRSIGITPGRSPIAEKWLQIGFSVGKRLKAAV